MEVFLWVLGIHLAELLAVGIFLLVRKNNILERAVIDQQQYIDSMSIIISNSEEKLKEFDINGALQSDDEVGVFFKNLKEIQSIISEFNSYRKK
jgi:hypothetical protein